MLSHLPNGALRWMGIIGGMFILLLAGGVLMWQSWIGNFHRMVQGSEEIRNMVTDTVPR